MTREESRSVFHAKVMLFGEYSLMAGSRALTIPYHAFSAELAFPGRMTGRDLAMAKASNKQLRLFFNFLSDQPLHDAARGLELSLERFGMDLEQGIYLHSTIPSGYGLGSSGALVAAVFQRYGRMPESGMDTGKQGMELPGSASRPEQEKWQKLKSALAAMESFFHGTSSGIDPMSCLLGRPLLLEPGGGAGLPALDSFSPDFQGGFFLVDTSATGQTGPLVRHFLEKYQEPGFKDLVDKQYVPLVNACIVSRLQNNASELLSLLPGLSAFQREHFLSMIPEQMQGAWDQGLASGAYTLKLCGSGGGGYLLGFTADLARAAEMLRPHTLLPLGSGTAGK